MTVSDGRGGPQAASRPKLSITTTRYTIVIRTSSTIDCGRTRSRKQAAGWQYFAQDVECISEATLEHDAIRSDQLPPARPRGGGDPGPQRLTHTAWPLDTRLRGYERSLARRSDSTCLITL